MKTLRILPANGLKIRDPRNGNPLPSDRTTSVPANQYWLRRLQSGDVLENVEPKPEMKEEPKAEQKKSRRKKDSDEEQKISENTGEE